MMATRKQSTTTVSRETQPADTAIAPKSTVVTMATEREAREATEAIRSHFDSFSTSYWKLGLAVKEGLDRQFAKALDMNVREWMVTCVRGKGQSIPKIYRAIKIVAALPGLSPDDLSKLSEGNAYALTQLPESKRKDADWLEKAKTMGNAEFEEAVDKELGVEPDKSWFVAFPKLPLSVKPIFQEVEKKLAEEVFQFDVENDPGKRVGMWEKILVSFYQDLQSDEGTANVRVWLVGEDENTLPKESE
jgi:hypothetical protein